MKCVFKIMANAKKVKKILTLMFFLVIYNANAGLVTTTEDTGPGSLRVVIAEALPGDVIYFDEKIDTITLNYAITIAKDLTIDGGIWFSNVVIILNSYSRVFNISFSDVTLNDIVFENGKINSFGGMGGALNVYKSKLTITNCNFNNNETVGGGGGAVYIYAGSNFMAINCNFNENNANVGGGVYVDSSSFMAVDCKFCKNNAKGTYSTGYGGAVYVNDNSSFIAENCSFIENNSGYGGGAVYIKEGANFIANGCIFDANKSNNIAAGIYIDGTFTADSCMFYNNTGYCAAVATLMKKNAVFTATNSIINNNTSIYNGGAVYILQGSFTATDCIFENNTSSNSAGGFIDIINGNFTATNCSFNENVADNGGAVSLWSGDAGFFTAINCTFYKNYSKEYSGAVDVNWGFFTAINCTFYENISDGYGGAVSIDSANFIIVNSTFSNNSSQYGGAINIATGGKAYLYHNTFDENKAEKQGGAINNYGTVYSYNCIYTANEENKNITPEGQISGIIIRGINLIHNDSTITREKVFGTKKITNGYIIPNEFAKTADRLFAFHYPPERAFDILEWLVTDQVNNTRPTKGNITFGSIEIEEPKKTITLLVNPMEAGNVTGMGNYDINSSVNITASSDSGYKFINWSDTNGTIVDTTNSLNITLISDTIIIANFNVVGILEEDIFDINIAPNPTENEFSIIFDNLEEQNISIELLDILGSKILNIYSGIAPVGKHFYKINTKLTNGTYLVKIISNKKTVIKKVILK